jgi:hypothetical protein
MKNCASKLDVRRLLAIFAAFCFTGLAYANPIGTSSVPFVNGQGTLTGFFQTNGSAQVTSWDLQTTTFDCNPCGIDHGFPGIHYTANTSTATIGFFFGFQSITFNTNDGSGWLLGFVLDCGGNGADCIGNATLGSTIPLQSAFEMNGIDFLPFRALTLASLSVTDPPIGLSFNLVPGNSAPEPQTLLLLLLALVGLVVARRRSPAHRA